MNAVEKHLARLKALHTELRSLGLEGAADEVAEEIASLAIAPTHSPRVAEYLGAVLELDRGLAKALHEHEREYDEGS